MLAGLHSDADFVGLRPGDSWITRINQGAREQLGGTGFVTLFLALLLGGIFTARNGSSASSPHCATCFGYWLAAPSSYTCGNNFPVSLP